jgi:hypothetical protein
MPSARSPKPEARDHEQRRRSPRTGCAGKKPRLLDRRGRIYQPLLTELHFGTVWATGESFVARQVRTPCSLRPGQHFAPLAPWPVAIPSNLVYCGQVVALIVLIPSLKSRSMATPLYVSA